MSRILASLITSVWAINRDRAAAYLPQVVKLMTGTSERLTQTELNAYRARLQPRMEMPGEPYDEENGGTAEDPITTATYDRGVMVLSMKDVVLKYDQSCGPYGAETYVEWLRSAEQDATVAGVVLDVDSPGGEGSGMRMVVEQLRTMKKPVVSLVRQGLAASAAYGIVASTKEVYASDPQDVFGSIGTYMTTADMYGYYEKEGLVMKDHYATLSTDKNGPFREAIEGKPERLVNEIIDPFNTAFIGLIKEARPAMAKTEAQWNTGRTFFADEALELGLIDGYNTMEGCIARVRALAASTPSTPKNKSTMSWKTNLMNALNKVFGTNEAVTAEAIAAVNTELAANGATEVEVMALAEATAARAAVAQVAELSAKLEKAEADMATLQSTLATELQNTSTLSTEVTNLTTQLSEAKARIELLENEGGSEGKPANANGGAGDKDPANTEKDPKDYAHNVAVRELLARM